MTDRKGLAPFKGALAVILSLLFVASASQGQNSDPVQDECNEGCLQTLEQYKKAGVNPSVSFLQICVRQCIRGRELQSKAEVPQFCRETCTGLMKSIGQDQNPQAVQACVENCTKDGYKRFGPQDATSTPQQPAQR